MAGVYFHIPFCHQKCHYCDFYSIRDSKGIADLIKSEIEEVFLRKNYLDHEMVKTIYFGGGTPSLLGVDQINDLLCSVRDNFEVDAECEITLEANPDDLSEEFLFELHKNGINRLSIGIQSFNDDILKFLGRRHDSKMLVGIVEFAQKVGFSNISADLIFAIPGMSFEVYSDSLEKIAKLGIQHVSAYSLSVEKGTYFYKLLSNSKISEVDEEEVLLQFNTTIDILAEHGFTQYEISNYAKEGYESKHNSSYWERKAYLGIGPSAHSYNGNSRQWNVSNTKNYCSNISLSGSYFELEQLTNSDKFNEYLMTGLRTSKGISLNFIKDNFEDSIFRYFVKEVKQILDSDLMFAVGDRLALTRKGMLISDYIVRKFYFV